MRDVRRENPQNPSVNFLRDLLNALRGFPPDVPNGPTETVIHDAVLGELRWDSGVGWWEGKFACPENGEFELIIPPSETESRTPEPQLVVHFASMKSLIAKSKGDAIDGFLPTFNEDWNDESPLTAHEFAQFLKAERIQLHDDGAIEISYAEADECEILGGHALVITVNRDGTKDVGIEG